MPRKKSKSLEVEYCDDGFVNIRLDLRGMRPKSGRGYRSVLYYEGNIKAAGMVAFLKLWRPVTKTQKKAVLKKFYKNMVAAKSPKII